MRASSNSTSEMGGEGEGGGLGEGWESQGLGPMGIGSLTGEESGLGV